MLEFLTKIILNSTSTYGKTIQKPVDVEIKFLNHWKKSENEPSAFEKYWQKNYNKIIEAHDVK